MTEIWEKILSQRKKDRLRRDYSIFIFIFFTYFICFLNEKNEMLSKLTLYPLELLFFNSCYLQLISVKTKQNKNKRRLKSVSLSSLTLYTPIPHRKLSLLLRYKLVKNVVQIT